MSRNFSPISRIINIIFHGIVLVALYHLAYGWSLEQTETFMTAIIPGGEARYGAYLIQFAPQVLLVIAAIYMARKDRRMAYLFFLTAIGVNLIDAYTNVTTFNELWPGLSAQLYALGRSQDFVEATKPVGSALAFMVTWFEEVGSLVAGSMLQVISEFAAGMGYRTPKFFQAEARGYLRAAAGDIGALRGEERDWSGPAPEWTNRGPQPQREQPATNGRAPFRRPSTGRPVRRM